MEDLFSEIAAAADGKDGEHGGDWVVKEGIGLMVVVVLKVDGALEGDSCIGLDSIEGTSTRTKV